MSHDISEVTTLKKGTILYLRILKYIDFVKQIVFIAGAYNLENLTAFTQKLDVLQKPPKNCHELGQKVAKTL